MARRKKGDPISGWVILNKSIGVSSTQAVGKCRWLFNAQKAGHGGTLDPLADGLLPIALGEATKCVPFIMDGEKQYRFTVFFGQSTSTDDREGDVLATSEERPTNAQIIEKMSDFIGVVTQTPPAYSAIKIDGQRAYDLARSGQEVKIKSREVEIYRLELINRPDQDRAEFLVDCGKGTYVRAIARDLGLKLGIPSHVESLTRTKCGPFDLKNGISLEKLEKIGDKAARMDKLHPVETALDDIPALALTTVQAAHIKNGQSVPLRRPTEVTPLDPLCWVHENGKPVAFGQFEGGSFKPSRVFNL